MNSQNRIRDQLRRNAVALISLVIAITSLGYNTWRNEHTENNRNQRWASFEILLMLGELEELIFLNHYDCDFTLRGNTRTGWAKVRTILDISRVIEESAPDSAQQLFDMWEENSSGFDRLTAESCRQRSADQRERNRQATEAIKLAIWDTRYVVLDVLYSLD